MKFRKTNFITFLCFQVLFFFIFLPEICSAVNVNYISNREPLIENVYILLPLGHWTHWAKERGGENLASAYWLYNRTGKPILLDLATVIFSQTEQWSELFLSEHPETWNWHGVNTVMVIKQPLVYYQETELLFGLETGYGCTRLRISTFPLVY